MAATIRGTKVTQVPLLSSLDTAVTLRRRETENYVPPLRVVGTRPKWEEAARFPSGRKSLRDWYDTTGRPS